MNNDIWWNSNNWFYCASYVAKHYKNIDPVNNYYIMIFKEYNPAVHYFPFKHLNKNVNIYSYCKY